MTVRRKLASTAVALAALVGGGALAVGAAPVAQAASPCYFFTPGIAGPGQGKGVHCEQSAPGSDQRIKITCKLPYGPYTTVTRYGPWKLQGGGYTSIAYCPDGRYYVAYRAYETR